MQIQSFLQRGTVFLREIAEQVKERVLEISVIGDGEGYPKIADAI
jgi:hypothetical protein